MDIIIHIKKHRKVSKSSNNETAQFQLYYIIQNFPKNKTKTKFRAETS